jgi:hypothetical protein
VLVKSVHQRSHRDSTLELRTKSLGPSNVLISLCDATEDSFVIELDRLRSGIVGRRRDRDERPMPGLIDADATSERFQPYMTLRREIRPAGSGAGGERLIGRDLSTGR